jgi:hypothetical protein
VRNTNNALRKLLKASAQSPKPDPDLLPWTVETRVLAAWRTGIDRNELTPLPALFRQALVCASMVMLLSIGWNYVQSRNETAYSMVQASYEMTVALLP